MKLKYIIPSFMAVVAMLVGCNEKFEAAHLDDLSVSSSYIAISADGNSPAEFTINAKSDWQIKNVPDWLTFSPQSGSAGDTKVIITAPATTDSRVATVKIHCNGGVLDVIVSQTAKKAEPVVISVAQALAIIKDNPSGSSARVKGIVCKIDEISPQYGNATYYLSDDGTYGDDNWLEVYRGKWIDGANFATGDEFAVGDELVVEGTMVLYSGKTPEFSQGSSVVSINKSLISVVEVEMLNIPEGKGVTEFEKEGGSAKITVASKGNGFHVTIPDAAKSWLHIEDFGPDYVTLHADANAGESRSVSVSLSTEAEGTLYSTEQSFKQKGIANPPSGTGTKADPYNVPAAIQYVKSLGADVESPVDVYVKGKISSIKFTYSAQYGTATYNISADGKEEEVFTVYGSYFFDNKPWEEGQTQINVGDEVVVCGKVIDFKGTTPEFSNKKNWLVSLNGKTSEGGHAGTADDPFDIASVISYIDAGGTGDVYVAGVVSKVQSQYSAKYGNAIFWISDDGNFNDDPSKDFEAYQVLWLENQSWTEGMGEVAVGDKVVLCGKVTKYNTTYETSAKKAYLYSLNGKTK